MTVQGFKDLETSTVDNLLAGEFPRVGILATITGGSYEKGTVLSKSDGKYTICSSEPEAILAETVDASAEDKKAVIYLTGEFNLSALKASVDVATLTDKLRNKSIFVKTNQGA